MTTDANWLTEQTRRISTTHGGVDAWVCRHVGNAASRDVATMWDSAASTLGLVDWATASTHEHPIAAELRRRRKIWGT